MHLGCEGAVCSWGQDHHGPEHTDPNSTCSVSCSPIQPCGQSVWAVVLGDPILGWEVVELPGSFHYQHLHDWYGKCFER